MIKRNELKEFNIETRNDVVAFASYVIEELKCNYHPDDSFADLVDLETDEQTFDDEAAAYLDSVNDRCFEIVGDKYYKICSKVLDKYFK